VLGLLVGPPIFGLLLEGSDSYAVAWAVYAALSSLVALVSLLARPAIDRESGVRS
jgi:cyanate permease